jgi:hypothetical protein
LPETIAQLADSLKRPAGSFQQGYVAERHPLVPELIAVWAPCGCYWVGSVGTGCFTTACMTEACDFQYVEVERALEALKQAENAIKETPNGISAVDGNSGVSDNLPEVGEGTEESEPSSTGRVIEGSPAEDMISEGSPAPVDYEMFGGEA